LNDHPRTMADIFDQSGDQRWHHCFGRGASRSPMCLSDKASHGPWVYGLQVIGLLGFKTMFEQFGRLACPVVGLACRKTGQPPLVRLGESRHAIAPGSLGSVKRFIGHGNQGESGRRVGRIEATPRLMVR